ncbi:MAG: TGS domain-containing protein, partial [Clostridia bacterium]
MLKAYLKDGNYIEFEEDSTAYDVVGLISSGLQRAALVVEIDGKICDLTTKINKDCKFIVHTFDTAPGKKAFWHTASHVLAHAVKRLYPNTKLAIGPAIENGFYYDFETETPFTPETLALLEAEMKKIIKEGFKLEKSTLTRDKAIELMVSRNEPYKQILIEELPEDEEISF